MKTIPLALAMLSILIPSAEAMDVEDLPLP
jgi:hypothetical protein